jgi:hypothetical protein
MDGCWMNKCDNYCTIHTSQIVVLFPTHSYPTA